MAVETPRGSLEVKGKGESTSKDPRGDFARCFDFHMPPPDQLPTLI